ncbi:MAG: Scr1 family TA system antitoxin-like transcriptional regulator [Pseudonocardiaceae bacterium]
MAVRPCYPAQPVGALVGGFRDGGGDPASPRVRPDGAAGVCLITQQVSGPGPGAATIATADPDPGHDRLEGQRIVAVPGGGDPRRLREARGVSLETVAEELKWSTSKISRIETAKIAVTPQDVRALLEVLEANDEVETLVSLAGEHRQPGWWRQYAEVLPTWFEGYLSLESEASHLLLYESEVIPGLLQTEDYAAQILRYSPYTPLPDEAARAAELQRRERHLCGGRRADRWPPRRPRQQRSGRACPDVRPRRVGRVHRERPQWRIRLTHPRTTPPVADPAAGGAVDQLADQDEITPQRAMQVWVENDPPYGVSFSRPGNEAR